eukprot:TRINITY_DN611_c0_g1_i1.p1 TRINITY_DN611_c0_g1~~TRINITY_DN611_c0_g1_i1.p1  ORF type:complete len:708 (+),score=218.85 TRINITY_DN611_c0_g1_i1:202-2124(+)
MAAKSEADGEEEAEIFAKFRCYCDKTLTNTSKTMKLLSEEIASTENRIEELIALDKELQRKRIRTEKDIKENLAARAEATEVRQKAFQVFLDKQADLVASLAQLTHALNTLTAPVLAQMSSGNGAGSDLLEVANVLDKARSHNLRKAALLQVPTKQESQTGGVAGVLRSTKDTYETNLEELRETESKQAKAFDGFIKTKTGEWTDLTAILEQTNSEIADTGLELGQRRGQLVAAKDNLGKTTTLNQETDRLCKEKTAINDERAMLRAQEDSALAKAIAVLNSDEAFETFGKTKTTGDFLQLKSVSRHSSAVDERRPVVLNLIEKAAHQLHSARLAGVAALVSTGNPFEKVLDEIKKMTLRISQEGDKDKAQFDTCADERKKNNAAKTQKEESIITLTASIDELHKSIDEMTTTIATKTEELANNDNEQKTQTEQRTLENKDYQENIAVLQQTQGLIAKATKILSDYYESIALVQTGETPPKTNDGKYEGQSSSGSAVISLLQDIMSNTKAEEKAAHEAEQKGQIEFEDSMKALTDEEASLKAGISETEGDLAQAKLDRDSKKNSLDITEEEKANIEAYLASIKSDCDFISINFVLRNENRAAEQKALDSAVEAIKGTPAYKKAAAQAVLDAKAASYSGVI